MPTPPQKRGVAARVLTHSRGGVEATRWPLSLHLNSHQLSRKLCKGSSREKVTAEQEQQ